MPPRGIRNTRPEACAMWADEQTDPTYIWALKGATPSSKGGLDIDGETSLLLPRRKTKVSPENLLP